MVKRCLQLVAFFSMILQLPLSLLSTDWKWIDFESKMVAINTRWKWKDAKRRNTRASPQHLPLNLNPLNFSLHTTFNKNNQKRGMGG